VRNASGNIYFTKVEPHGIRITVQLATLCFLFLMRQLPCIRNCFGGESFLFSAASHVDLIIQQSSRPKILFHQDSGHGVSCTFQWILGETDISVTNCGLGIFDVWLPPPPPEWRKQELTLWKTVLKSVSVVLITKVQVVWLCQMFENYFSMQ
jgi:hypothetical protein